jgi:hypothetical protein
LPLWFEGCSRIRIHIRLLSKEINIPLHLRLGAPEAYVSSISARVRFAVSGLETISTYMTSRCSFRRDSLVEISPNYDQHLTTSKHQERFSSQITASGIISLLYGCGFKKWLDKTYASALVICGTANEVMMAVVKPQNIDQLIVCGDEMLESLSAPSSIYCQISLMFQTMIIIKNPQWLKSYRVDEVKDYTKTGKSKTF